MLDSGDLDFSFSGLKTAVLYAVKDKSLTTLEKAALAREFEDAVTEVLLKKTKAAIDTHNVASLIVGGGVSANRHIRETFSTYFEKEYPALTLYFPSPNLSTDNSVMIALAGHAHAEDMNLYAHIQADGNSSLHEA
jgi:N6-L-threonylcarbamoyladenine synthase